MAEKVRVSREVAESLDDLLLLNTNNDVMKIYFDAINVSEARQIPKSAWVIKNLEPMQLAIILLNGYEIEQTPEEELACIYQSHEVVVCGSEAHFNKGIKTALHILGIKIKGINE